MTKGCLFYTDFNADPLIQSVCLEQLKKSWKGETVSVSLNKPLNFGKNIIIADVRGYVTMMRQILVGLENLTTDYVFFCESDVLYPKEHFDFTPPTNDIFYYNQNNWRWMFGTDKAIQYDRMLPLSCLCANRKLALDFYRLRMAKIEEVGLDKFDSREPTLARKWGYEPGTKKKRRGGLTNDEFWMWNSSIPVIDIRHDKTFSSPKVRTDEFKHQPNNWKQVTLTEIPGWDLSKLFNL